MYRQGDRVRITSIKMPDIWEGEGTITITKDDEPLTYYGNRTNPVHYYDIYAL